MSDWLKLHDLSVTCNVGVFDWEREQAQQVWIDVEVPVNARQAAAHDDVRHTVDYGALITAIRNRVEHHTYRLIETIAEEVATVATKDFGAPQVFVKVKKRSLPGVGEAMVELTRP